jgi:hypothetical protein
MRPNKLEGLYLAITYQSSVAFAGNTESLSKKETFESTSNWVCSGLALKFKDLTGKGLQGKPSSILGLVISDKGKRFYNIDIVNNIKLFYSSLNKLEHLSLSPFLD